MKYLKSLPLVAACVSGTAISSESKQLVMPEAMELSGHGEEIGPGSSSGAFDPGAAILVNPALLGVKKTYEVTGSYHWPVIGREFYQASIVDSVTTEYGTGVFYQGSKEEFEPTVLGDHDSPVNRRLAIGVSHKQGPLLFGLTGQYLEGQKIENHRWDQVDGTNFGVGVVYMPNATYRIGVSRQNIGNDELSFLAPETTRFGVTAMLLDQKLQWNVDYKIRKRIAYFEDPQDVFGQSLGYGDDEKIIHTSARYAVDKRIGVVGTLGQSLSEDKRKQGGMGVSYANKSYNITYGLFRPQLNVSETHHTVSLSLSIDRPRKKKKRMASKFKL